VYVQLGVAYQRARDRNKAELAYAKALALDPKSAYAWSNYASLDATSAGFYDSAAREVGACARDRAGLRSSARRLGQAQARRRAQRALLSRLLELAYGVHERRLFESPRNGPGIQKPTSTPCVQLPR
jgi:tetratricopeptide (TPR) repeat protein